MDATADAAAVVTGFAVVAVLVAFTAGRPTITRHPGLFAPLDAPGSRRVGVRHLLRRRSGPHLVWRTLPECADLLALCLGAGLAVPAAVARVGTEVAGPVAETLRHIDRRHRRGQTYTEAVAEVTATADPLLQPLLGLLAAAHVDGGPAVESLHRLAADLREQRRRRGEAAARRTPVALLFPLVFCVLPAFVLLALVPLLAGSFEGLSLP